MSLADKEKKRPDSASPPGAVAPEPAESQPAEALPADLQSQLEQKTQEAQDNYDRLLRLAAEMENLKKRQERDRADLLQFANENLIKELLPVLDNLERALEHGRQCDCPSPFLEGLDLVLKDFLKALGRFGVTPLEAVGQPFDPAFHHAVMEEEAPEVANQTVVKELQKGYLLHGRLLRPAMVAVAKNVQKNQSQSD